MPIVRISDGASKSLKKGRYTNEAELERFVFDNPGLLTSNSTEPTIAPVATQVTLPNAGRLDVLMVDEKGTPIAVELKLAANHQSRREVVAQVFDYVSSLTLMTVDELDEAVDGRLDEALRSFDDNVENGEAFVDRRRACGASLRAGQARVIVVVDDAPDDLVRIIRFMNEHSDLDVRLVSVSRYEEDKGTDILVPAVLVHSEEQGSLRKRQSRPRSHKSEAKELLVAAIGSLTSSVEDLITSRRFKRDKPFWVHASRCLVAEGLALEGAGIVAIDTFFEGLVGGERAIYARFQTRGRHGSPATRIATIQSYGEQVKQCLSVEFGAVDFVTKGLSSKPHWRIPEPNSALESGWTIDLLAETAEAVLRCFAEVVPFKAS